MNTLKIFFKNLSGKARLLLFIYFIMALGVITFLASPFLLIWCSWSIAWRVGLTGLLTSVTVFVAWWLLYNTFFATKKATQK